MENDIVFVLQRTVKKFKIRVTEDTVRKYLLSHPHYPSLKSICDSLKKWKVEYYALKMEANEIRELEIPFITHLNFSGGKIAFVERIENNKVFYTISKETKLVEEFDKFAEKLSGAVILLNPGKDSGEKEYRQLHQNEILNKLLLPLGIATMLILILGNLSSFSFQTVSHLDFRTTVLFFTKIIGIIASLFLVLHELKIDNPVAEKICRFSSKTDCNAVLSSDASKLFGWISWADIGLIYFIGTLIYLSFSNGLYSLGLLTLISILALPYTVFSIYYQAVKAKKWCPFCLLVQFALIVEFGILLPLLRTISFIGTDIINLIISFSVPAALWLVFKVYYKKTREFEEEQVSLLTFKRNPEIFKSLFKQNGYVEILEDEQSLVLGNPAAQIMITSFLSLNCSPCVKEFRQIKSLLDNCQDVKVNIIFSVLKDKESHNLINYLYYLQREKGTVAATEFLYQIYLTDSKNRNSLYIEDIPDSYKVAEQICEKNLILAQKCKVPGTPTTYVQGYKFPKGYDYYDIQFFIDDIIQIKMENQRQEALVI